MLLRCKVITDNKQSISDLSAAIALDEEDESEQDEFAGEDDLSESGEDWDAAEKRALQDDRSRKRDDEVDEGRSKKKSRR